jgi:hypothetical protein
MAQLNEILVGRFNRGLQKLFGIKGHTPVASLAPEIMPVSSVFSGQETRYLDGWNRYSGSIAIAAQAAATVGLQVHIPVGVTTLLVVIEKISIETAAAQEIDLSQSLAIGSLGTAQGASGMDTRQKAPPASPSAVLSSSILSPTPGNMIERLFPPALQTFSLVDPGIILANVSSGVRLTTTLVNTAVNFTFQWRERVLEEVEAL